MAKPNRLARNIFYVGFDKQTSKGTGVEPVYFPQYFDGDISINPERDFETYVAAGSQYPSLSLMQKFRQPGALGVLGTPQIVALLSSYFLGDEKIKGTQPAVPVATTLDGDVAAEAATFDVAEGHGSDFEAGDFLQIVSESDAYEATGEIVEVDSILTDTITPKTALKYAHTSGDVVEQVTAPFFHQSLYETRADMPWFSTEVSAGYDSEQTDPIIARLVDCRMATLEMKCQSGMPFILSAALQAIDIEKQESEAAESYESNDPFQFYHGTYTVDLGATTMITNFALSLANRLDTDDFTNSITPADIPVLGRDGKVSFVLKLDDGTRLWDTYMKSGHASVIESLYEGDFNIAFTYGTGTSIRSCTIDIPLIDHVSATPNIGPGDGTLEYACEANLKLESGSEFMTVVTGDDNHLKYVS